MMMMIINSNNNNKYPKLFFHKWKVFTFVQGMVAFTSVLSTLQPSVANTPCQGRFIGSGTLAEAIYAH